MAAIGVFCASSQRLDGHWLNLGYRVGVEIGQRGHSLVSGGGCVGMMGAVADGARAAGAYTYGVIPQALVDLEVADTRADELVITDGMASRKNLIIAKADAFITLPGGLGTLDEFFEVWTTCSLGGHDKPVLLLDAEGFYAGLLDWLRDLAAARFVREEALALLLLASTIREGFDRLEVALRR